MNSTVAPVSSIRLLMANMPSMLSDLLRSAFRSVDDIAIYESINDVMQLSGALNNLKTPIDVVLLGSLRTSTTYTALPFLEPMMDRVPVPKAIVLTQQPDYDEAISLFRAGARGILCTQDLNFDLLCKSIRCVQRGEIWASNDLTAHLVASLSRPRSMNVVDVQGRSLLTAREQQVLHLLAEGLSNYELAMALKLSEHTVKNHLFRIFDKLGVSSRMEAVLYAVTPRHSPLSGKLGMKTTAVADPVELKPRPSSISRSA
jgi:DNA-binding NarL/FixJ family response regulator